VKRIVFPPATTRFGFYRLDQTIDHRVYPNRQPLRRVEGVRRALGSLYATNTAWNVIIRIGKRHPGAIDKRRLAICSARATCAQLVSIGIDHPGIRFEIVYGVSGNTRSWYDNSNAARLGYGRRTMPRPMPPKCWRGNDRAIRARDVPGRCSSCKYEEVPNPAAPPKKSKGKKK